MPKHLTKQEVAERKTKIIELRTRYPKPATWLEVEKELKLSKKALVHFREKYMRETLKICSI